MDWETIVAGLLHDTVEDTDAVTFESIEDLYGPTVRRIVEGETKVDICCKYFHCVIVVAQQVNISFLLPACEVIFWLHHHHLRSTQIPSKWKMPTWMF